MNTRAFLEELKSIMTRHDVAFIDWECGDGSDTHGIYDSHLVLKGKDGSECRFYGDSVGTREIEERIEEL